MRADDASALPDTTADPATSPPRRRMPELRARSSRDTPPNATTPSDDRTAPLPRCAHTASAYGGGAIIFGGRYMLPAERQRQEVTWQVIAAPTPPPLPFSSPSLLLLFSVSSPSLPLLFSFS